MVGATENSRFLSSRYKGQFSLFFVLANLFCRGRKIICVNVFFPNSAKNPIDDIVHLVKDKVDNLVAVAQMVGRPPASQ